MLSPVLAKNDKKAAWLIGIVSFVVFAAVVLLSKYKLTNVDLGFNPHLFATFNAVVNSIVSILLALGLIAVKLRKYSLHKKIMFTAMVLSILFLVSYICHHLFAGETKFGDLDHSGALDAAETARAGSLRIVYYIILITHIPLAAIVLPFILFTAYRGMIAEWPGHRKLARITWPIWFYVAVTGVVVYLMINPYY